VVTEVSSNTLVAHPDWRFQFYVCGIAGLVVFLVALVGLGSCPRRCATS